MQVFNFNDIFSENAIKEFHQWLQQATWYSGVPGGFVTNSPKRLVNAYGDGSTINQEGQHYGPNWKSGYWTAKMNQSHLTLETPTQQIPPPLSKLIPKCRELFQRVFPDAQITDNTFNIAVCNYYTDPDMYIAAHKDDNPWYPEESSVGPVFASFTIYPEGEPESDQAFARFQIRQNNQWQDVKLPTNSLLIMPSNIEHRVKPCLKRYHNQFKPRINITLRSTFSLTVNPLMNAMATSNHSRYYKLPSKIIAPSDTDLETYQSIVDIYNRFLTQYDVPPLLLVNGSDKTTRQQQKKLLVKNYRKLSQTHGYLAFRGSANMVSELFDMVIKHIETINT